MRVSSFCPVLPDPKDQADIFGLSSGLVRRSPQRGTRTRTRTKPNRPPRPPAKRGVKRLKASRWMTRSNNQTIPPGRGDKKKIAGSSASASSFPLSLLRSSPDACDTGTLVGPCALAGPLDPAPALRTVDHPSAHSTRDPRDAFSREGEVRQQSPSSLHTDPFDVSLLLIFVNQVIDLSDKNLHREIAHSTMTLYPPHPTHLRWSCVNSYEL